MSVPSQRGLPPPATPSFARCWRHISGLARHWAQAGYKLLLGSRTHALLGDNVRVASAFQNVAANHLQGGHGLSCDVLVCGDKKNARAEIIKLAQATGMRGFHTGSIANAAAFY